MRAMHTPGPWKSDGTHLSISTEGDPYSHGPMCIADVRGWGHLTGRGGGCGFRDQTAVEIQKANAQLIAAAPDILRALKGLLALHESMLDLDKLKATFDAARAAIAKAEGR